MHRTGTPPHATCSQKHDQSPHAVVAWMEMVSRGVEWSRVPWSAVECRGVPSHGMMMGADRCTPTALTCSIDRSIDDLQTSLTHTHTPSAEDRGPEFCNDDDDDDDDDCASFEQPGSSSNREEAETATRLESREREELALSPFVRAIASWVGNSGSEHATSRPLWSRARR